METVIIQLINPKAYKILQDLEELGIIRILKEPSEMSSLRHHIKNPMNNEEIDKQLKASRKEWERDILK